MLFEVLLIEIQEEIHHFAGWEGGGLRGTKMVNKTFVNKLAFPNHVQETILFGSFWCRFKMPRFFSQKGIVRYMCSINFFVLNRQGYHAIWNSRIGAHHNDNLSTILGFILPKGLNQD